MYEYARLIEDVMTSYSAVVNVVMSPDHPDESMLNRVEALVKIFISFVEELDNNIVKSGNNKIETAACFVNLLGLLDKMEMFGVMRNFWEGGLRGEGIFLPLKESINRGFHCRGICKRVLLQQYQFTSISNLIAFEKNIDNFNTYEEASENIDVSNQEELIDDVRQNFDKERYRKYHCYDRREIVIEIIDGVKPLAIAYYIPSKTLFAIV